MTKINVVGTGIRTRGPAFAAAGRGASLIAPHKGTAASPANHISTAFVRSGLPVPQTISMDSNVTRHPPLSVLPRGIPGSGRAGGPGGIGGSGGGGGSDKKITEAWNTLKNLLIEHGASPNLLKGIESAYKFAKAAHKGQVRASGEPYVMHPLRSAALIVRHLKFTDEATIIAVLLHDVIEDTNISNDEIMLKFGKDVLDLVDGVTKFGRTDLSSAAARKEKSLEKLFGAIIKDVRIAVIKLADRCDNIQTLDFLAPSKRARIARETFEIYAPLAGLLGLWGFKEILEDHSFKHIRPAEEFEQLTNLLKEEKGAADILAYEAKDILEQELKKSGINDPEVLLKFRTNYNAAIEWKRKGESAGILFPVEHFVVIVPKIDDCYRALGIIHRAFNFAWGRITDYIPSAGSNFYQSLNTDIYVGSDVVRVMIRTEEMESLAKRGIIAWIYELGRELGEEWLGKTKDWRKAINESKELYEDIRARMDEIFIYTRDGQKKFIPRGWTLHDLAFLIHSDLGIAASHAIVDGAKVALGSVLRVGARVEIIKQTDLPRNPGVFWWSVSKNNRLAWEAIRRHFAALDDEINVLEGRKLLSRVFEDELDLDYTDKDVQRFLSVSGGGKFFRRISPLLKDMKIRVESVSGIEDLEYAVGVAAVSPWGIAEEFRKYIDNLFRRKIGYDVKLSLNFSDRPGLLGDIGKTFEKLGINLTEIMLQKGRNHLAFNVKSEIAVMRVINALLKIEGVKEVKRDPS